MTATVAESTTLRRLDQKAVSGAPVVDHGRVVGVVTRRDHGVNRLPVVDQTGRPIGVLTRDDVLGAVARGVQP